MADARRPAAAPRIGRVEVVCGPMFAGKTEELLRRVRRAVIAGRRVVVIGHALDTRHGADRVASHIGVDFPALAAARPEDIEALVTDGTDVVAIDEAQFFGPGLLPVVARLADRGLVVIVAGLDVTFDGDPFEPLPSLMALAERVDTLTELRVGMTYDATVYASDGRRSDLRFISLAAIKKLHEGEVLGPGETAGRPRRSA